MVGTGGLVPVLKEYVVLLFVHSRFLFKTTGGGMIRLTNAILIITNKYIILHSLR